MKKCYHLFLTILVLFAFSFTIGVTNSYSEEGDATGAALSQEEVVYETSDALTGYNVLLTNGPGNYGPMTEIRLSNLGASVTLVSPGNLTSDLLAANDVLWIALGDAHSVVGKKDIILSYLAGGGGLILEQPDVIGDIEVLPYHFNISSEWYDGECTRNVLKPSHELIAGLDPGVLPACYDTVGSIGPEWEVLVEDGTGDPSLSVACYEAGKIIVELGNTSTYSCVCGICMDNVMIERMVKYAAVPCDGGFPGEAELEALEAKLDGLSVLPVQLDEVTRLINGLVLAVEALEVKSDAMEAKLDVIQSKVTSGEVVTQNDLAAGQGGVYFMGAEKQPKP